MKTLSEIYVELMKQHKDVSQEDFIECYYAYKNGEVKNSPHILKLKNSVITLRLFTVKSYIKKPLKKTTKLNIMQNKKSNS